MWFFNVFSEGRQSELWLFSSAIMITNPLKMFDHGEVNRGTRSAKTEEKAKH